MNEPRIHFAIVCASIVCASIGSPQFLNEAYRAESLDEQLTRNANAFFADSTKFHYDATRNTFYVSSILEWFGEDFGESESARLKRIAARHRLANFRNLSQRVVKFHRRLVVIHVPVHTMSSQNMNRRDWTVATDESLLDAYQREQCHDAFTEIVRRYHTLVLTWVRRVVNRDVDAEDACQATFFALAKSAHSISTQSALQAWLRQTAKNCAIEILRCQMRQPCSPTNRATESEAAMENSYDLRGETPFDHLANQESSAARPIFDAAMPAPS